MLAGRACKGKGAMRFSRDMRRYREAVANPLAPGRFEHGPVAHRQRHHFREPRPDKADAGEIACAMNGIDTAKRIRVLTLTVEGSNTASANRSPNCGKPR